jgi:hypothetical protein
MHRLSMWVGETASMVGHASCTRGGAAPTPTPHQQTKTQSTHRSVGSFKAIDLLLCAGELLLGHHRLQHLEDIVPERVVVLVQEDNEAGRLRVEAGGHMENGLLSDVGDLLV